mgnify:CR=1 FL=1
MRRARTRKRRLYTFVLAVHVVRDIARRRTARDVGIGWQPRARIRARGPDRLTAAGHEELDEDEIIVSLVDE